MTPKKVIGFIAAAAVLAGIIFGIAAIVKNNRINAMRTDAANWCRQGRYEEALEVFLRFDDDNARSWVQTCRQGIADRDAKELLEAGRPAEALALLEREYPESSLMPEVLLARAKELTAQGEAGEALALLRGAPETREIRDYLPLCELAAEEKRFASLLAEGRLEEAGSSLAAMEKTGRMAAEQLAEYRREYALAVAAEDLRGGRYASAFNGYMDLSDDAGMAAVLDAMAAAGKTDTAFRYAAKMPRPDISRLDALFSRLAEGDLSLMDRPMGGLACKGVDLAGLLSGLLAQGSGEADALAAKIAGLAAEECRGLIAEGEHAVPWYALDSLRQAAPALWTDELQALMDSCVSEPPANGVIRDAGASAASGATVTVYNQSSLGLIFSLWSEDRAIYVYVGPHSKYTFTVRAGKWSPSLCQGERWFGKDGFGQRGWRDVEVNNGTQTVKLGERLEGSYSITVK